MQIKNTHSLIIMSSSSNSPVPPTNTTTTKSKRPGVDTLLTTHGKALEAGQGLSIRLIKGPNPTSNPDPVDPKAPHQTFPLLAKFPVSVVKPDFVSKRLRFYQQDVPKAVEDSDEEAEQEADGNAPKRRWKSRRNNQAPARQWILQPEVEFLETMLARREKPGEGDKNNNNEDEIAPKKKKHKPLSTRYEGEPEVNTSHYLVLRRLPADATVLNPDTVLPGGRCLQACLVPANAMVAFAQPDARKTFTLSQAERVIQDQRHGVVQTLHHLHDEDEKAAEATTLQEFLGRRRGTAAANKPKDAKGRLWSKFQKMDANTAGGEVDDGDDVMADVAYRNRKGAGSARKELLETVGDAVKVSDEGVIGGANDAEFGGRQRFGQYKSDPNNNNNDKNARNAESQSAPQERGADGGKYQTDAYMKRRKLSNNDEAKINLPVYLFCFSFSLWDFSGHGGRLLSA